MEFLAGSMAPVNVGAMFMDLVRMVIVPVASGSILGSVFVRQGTRIRPTFAPRAIIFLGLIMMGSMSKGTGALLKQLYTLLYLVPGCVLFSMVGYSIGFYIPGLFGFTKKQRIAACFEVGVANAALTMTLAGKYFGPLAVLVSILYGKVMVIMGSVVIVPLFGEKEETAVAEGRGLREQKIVTSPE
jgi:BASS family bile acid:Na+ symporter